MYTPKTRGVNAPVPSTVHRTTSLQRTFCLCTQNRKRSFGPDIASPTAAPARGSDGPFRAVAALAALQHQSPTSVTRVPQTPLPVRLFELEPKPDPHIRCLCLLAPPPSRGCVRGGAAGPRGRPCGGFGRLRARGVASLLLCPQWFPPTRTDAQTCIQVDGGPFRGRGAWPPAQQCLSACSWGLGGPWGPWGDEAISPVHLCPTTNCESV